MRMTGFLFLTVLLASCASKNFVRREPGQIIESNKNLKNEVLEPDLNISFQKVEFNNNPLISVSITKTNKTRVSWTDIYTSVDVYEESCKSFASKIYTAYFDPSDIKSNAAMCESKVPTKETIMKDESKIDKAEESLDGLNAKLTIGSNFAFSKVKNGAAQFSYKELKLAKKKLPTDITADLEVGNISIDVSSTFNFFARNQNAPIEREENEKEIAIQNVINGDGPPVPLIFEHSGEWKMGNCIDSRMFPFRIIQKLNDHTYEMVSEISDFGGIHILLRTRKGSFNNAGHPVGISVKHTGSKAVTLQNGFESKYAVFSECVPVP
ncbi:MAG: hypothetical protein ACXVCY_12825 [Pseudobdellovibrionaceae bacterium]